MEQSWDEQFCHPEYLGSYLGPRGLLQFSPLLATGREEGGWEQ